MHGSGIGLVFPQFTRCCLDGEQVQAGRPNRIASLQLLPGNDGPLGLLQASRGGGRRVKLWTDGTNLRQWRTPGEDDKEEKREHFTAAAIRFSFPERHGLWVSSPFDRVAASAEQADNQCAHNCRSNHGRPFFDEPERCFRRDAIPSRL